MDISFDRAKRRRNLAKHGLDPADAEPSFAGVHIDQLDDRYDYGEDRYVTAGLLGAEVAVCVWADWGEVRRIMSLSRRASADEQQDFSKASGPMPTSGTPPPLGKHFFATGALKAGEITLRPATDTMARRGRPPQGSAAKIQQSLRLSPEVLDHFRGTGKGWQARIDEVLRHVVEAERALALAGALPASTPVECKVKEDVKRFGDLITGPGPGRTDGIDPRFADVLERISRATAAMLGMSQPQAFAPPARKGKRA